MNAYCSDAVMLFPFDDLTVKARFQLPLADEKSMESRLPVRVTGAAAENALASFHVQDL